jgi:hypothetical protein
VSIRGAERGTTDQKENTMTRREHKTTESDASAELVRVELHEAPDDDYERVHVATWTRGFVRAVRHTPTGTHYVVAAFVSVTWSEIE